MGILSSIKETLFGKSAVGPVKREANTASTAQSTKSETVNIPKATVPEPEPVPVPVPEPVDVEAILDAAVEAKGKT